MPEKPGKDVKWITTEGGVSIGNSFDGMDAYSDGEVDRQRGKEADR